jgi:thioesterase domain-containing protein
MNREQREAKIRELAEAYAERLRQAWPEGETDVTGIEEIPSMAWCTSRPSSV